MGAGSSSQSLERTSKRLLDLVAKGDLEGIRSMLAKFDPKHARDVRYALCSTRNLPNLIPGQSNPYTSPVLLAIEMNSVAILETLLRKLVENENEGKLEGLSGYLKLDICLEPHIEDSAIIKVLEILPRQFEEDVDLCLCVYSRPTVLRFVLDRGFKPTRETQHCTLITWIDSFVTFHFRPGWTKGCEECLELLIDHGVDPSIAVHKCELSSLTSMSKHYDCFFEAHEELPEEELYVYNPMTMCLIYGCNWMEMFNFARALQRLGAPIGPNEIKVINRLLAVHSHSESEGDDNDKDLLTQLGSFLTNS